MAANTNKFERGCPICCDIPKIPKILPCQHIYCVECLESWITRKTESGEPLSCAECRDVFSVLPRPEPGCDPIGAIHEEFSSDEFVHQPTYAAIISDQKYKVMGLTVLSEKLYAVYHKQSSVHIYNTSSPFDKVSSTDVGIRWPRGIASSQRHHCVFITDWHRMFGGRLWKVTENAREFTEMATLDVQPFGISVCAESDQVLVVCSTPLRRALPLVSKSSRLIIFDASSQQCVKTIPLDDSLEIPRHALAIDERFVVCHGWLRAGKLVVVDSEGHQLHGTYGSDVPGGSQSLSRPLSLCYAGSRHILVTDYYQHRIHLVTRHLQFVRHFIADTNQNNLGYPRQVCLDSSRLYVGTESGTIGIYGIS